MNNKNATNSGRGIWCRWASVLLFVSLAWISGTANAAVTVCADNSGAGWAIPDAVTTGPPAGRGPGTVNATGTFSFGDDVGNILDLTVTTNITHTWIGDLDVTLTSPTATSVELFNQPNSGAGTCSGDNVAATFDDASGTDADTNCGAGTPALNGTFSPNALLSSFDGISPNGDWTLTVNDNLDPDTGSVDSFCLNLDVAALTMTKYASTNATCSDNLTSLTVTGGTDVYYCYTVTNTGTETLTIASGDITDDQGIDISSLEGTYNPSGTAGDSKTYVAGPYTAETDPLLPIGDTTNIASVSATWASGTLSTSKQATVSVQASVPSTGDKALYLDTNTLTRVAPGAALNVQIDGNNQSVSWPLAALTKAITIDGSGTIPVTLVRSETGPGSNRTFTITLSADNGVGTIASWSGTEAVPGTATAFQYDLAMDAGWGGGDVSVSIGSIITLTITNNSGAANNRYFVTEVGSQVDLPSKTVINVDSVTFYDAANTTQIFNVIPNTNINVRAVISDPFGSADINPPTGPAGLPGIEIFDPTPTSQNTGTMTLLSEDTAAGTRTYTYAYTVPVAATAGTWQAEVTATEGFETGAAEITHAGTGDLAVTSANLTIVKTANKASAKPGELIVYTVTIVNTGVGPATAVEIGDAMSAYSAFALDPFGNPAGTSQPFNFNLTNTSGSSTLAFGTPDYATTGPVWGKTLTDGDGGAPAGYDGLVTNWKVTFTGNLQAGDQFTLQYGTTAK